jgi:hypothetical protein
MGAGVLVTLGGGNSNLITESSAMTAVAVKRAMSRVSDRIFIDDRMRGMMKED